jgi:hypothetical protein
MARSEGIIIIGGGTQGARTIEHEFQPFLRIDGRTCIEIVLDEATKTNNSFPVYLWGPEKTLKELLSPLITREKGKREIQIVPERPSPIDSLISTYLESFKKNDGESRTIDDPSDGPGGDGWSMQKALAAQRDTGKRMFYLPSDIPLISSKEMDFLIENAEPGYDLLWGWSLRNGFEAVLRALQQQRSDIDMSRTKFNFSHFVVNGQLEEARFNNTYCGYPLRIDPDLYLFIQMLYQNRNLINKEQRRGKVRKRLDLPNFTCLLGAFGRYVSSRRKEAGAKVFVYGYRILNTYFHSLGLEGKNFRFVRAFVRALGRFDKRPSRSSIERNFAEENVRKLTGNRIGMFFSDIIGPLLDIDTAYEYEFVKAHFGRLREAIEGYYATCGIRRLP